MKFNTLTATLSTVALTTAFGLYASIASALTLNSSSGTWDNVVLQNGIIVGTDGVPAPSYRVEFLTGGSEVRWGRPVTPAGKSGLKFTGVGFSSFDVGEIFKIGTLEHFNNAISSAATAAELNITLNFSDPAISQVFNFAFGINETTNNATPCPAGDTAPCDDIITFPNAFPSSTFSIDGMDFTLELLGFSDSPDGTPINQFISQEFDQGTGTNSTMLFGRITKKSVPEPATMLGVSMLGIYFVSRRGHKAKV